MWIILDEEDEKYLDKRNSSHLTGSYVKGMASLIIRINSNDNTYTVLKDRYNGEMGEIALIENLPSDLNHRMAKLLRLKDGVDIDD